jgi:hypothetical protein
MARIFIGLEFLLGAWLILGVALRTFTLKAVIALLLFFCAYLLYLQFVKKETGNCGCFGTSVVMTPVQALLKNVLLIFIAVLLSLTDHPYLIRKKAVVLALAVLTGLAAFILPFALNPLNAYSESFAKEKVNYRPPLELLYDKSQADTPRVDLRQGKWIVAFLSLKCSHCKLAAYKLNVMHNKNAMLPIYFVLNGKKKNLDEFNRETNAQKVPHNFLKGKDNFLKLVGPVYPVIFWLHDGVVEKKSTHVELEQADIEAWMKE